MITVFVGDIDESLAHKAQKLESTAQLICKDNFQNLTPGVYYTSLGDFESAEQFNSVLTQADTLIYSPPDCWSDQQNNYSGMKQATEYFLTLYTGRKNVQNLPCDDNLKNFLALPDQRKTDTPQLWSAGCSITHGFALEPETTYIDIISKHMQLPVSKLSQSGASIEWSADAILRSDLRAQDTLIWGLTSHQRFAYWQNSSPKHVHIRLYEKEPEFDKIISLERLDDENLIYKSLTHVYQVINFCEKLNVKLILVGLLTDIEQFSVYLRHLPNYIQMMPNLGRPFEWWMDLASDGRHPGPMTHQYYAQEIIKKFTL